MQITGRRAMWMGVVMAGAITAMPASAVEPFGAAVRATRDGCVNSNTVLDSHGDRHGFIICSRNSSSGLYYVSAAGGATTWSLDRVGPSGYLLAATDDGTAAYAVYDANDGNGDSTYLVKRSRSGATSRRVLSRDVAASSASIVARNGQWWAVWSQYTKDSGAYLCHFLFQSRTIGGWHGKQPLHRCGHDPSLTFGSNGSPMLASGHQAYEEGGDIELSRWKSGGWTKPRKLNRKEFGRQPFLDRTGHVTRVAWFHQTENFAYDVMLVTKRDGGSWRRKHFTRQVAFDDYVQTRPPMITVSGGNVFVGWNTVKPNNKEEAHIAARDSNGTWTS
ncbi:MAG: hypothetical protein QOJ03_3397, partial [Frankiaceae bacterium]|nr:hypothetical protein [Frankiaceae bacterium]